MGRRVFLPEIRKKLSDSIEVGFERNMLTDDNGFLKVHIHIYDNGEEKKMPFPGFWEINMDYSFFDAMLYDNYVIIYGKRLGKDKNNWTNIIWVYDTNNHEFANYVDEDGFPVYDFDYRAVDDLTPFKNNISVIDLLAIINRWDQNVPEEFTDKQMEDLKYYLSFITDGDESISREEIDEHIFSEFPVLKNYQCFDKPISWYKNATITDDIYDKFSVEEEFNSNFSDVDCVLFFIISQIKRTKSNDKVKRRKK